MRQRAVIAMAMTNDPDVLIADEPTTALDVTIQAQVLDTLHRVQENTSAGIILITHDLGVVAGMADQVLVMYAGKPVEVGPTDAIYYDPRMPYTLGLLGSLPRLDAKGSEPLTPIRGAPPSLINLPPGCPFSPRCPMSRAHCDEEEPALRPVAGVDHVAACHYAEELAGDVRADEVFETTEADLQALEELGQLDTVEEAEATQQAEDRA
jgi:oligopeptide/dipeptide ABC transporter ATP-binding protein